MAGTFRLWDDLIKLMIKDREVYFKALDSMNFPEELARVSANMEHIIDRIRRLSDCQIPEDLIRDVLLEKLQEKNVDLDYFFNAFSRICWLDYGWKMFNSLNPHVQSEDINSFHHIEAILELLFAILEKYFPFTDKNMIGLELSFISENPYLKKSIIPLIFKGDEKTLRRISEEVFMWNMGKM